jgi:hypothetical protein
VLKALLIAILPHRLLEYASSTPTPIATVYGGAALAVEVGGLGAAAFAGSDEPFTTGAEYWRQFIGGAAAIGAVVLVAVLVAGVAAIARNSEARVSAGTRVLLLSPLTMLVPAVAWLAFRAWRGAIWSCALPATVPGYGHMGLIVSLSSLWWVLLILGGGLVSLLYALRREQQVPGGWECGTCGYSLEGLPARILCPECGSSPWAARWRAR